MLKQHDNKGQGLVEYGLIMMLVALVILIVMVLLGPAVGNMYSNVMYNF
jgi:pilus assembly protein Flp/PilA